MPHSRHLRVIIETPRGSQNKFAFNPDLKLFELKGVLPQGSSFPYDFGFVPSTQGQDGDPLDVLVLMDAPTFPGCLVEARLIGALEAEQSEKGQAPERNDRLLAVAAHSRQHQHIHQLSSLPNQLIHEIEHFFAQYNAAKGHKFRVLRRVDSESAAALVRVGAAAFRAKEQKATVA